MRQAPSATGNKLQTTQRLESATEDPPHSTRLTTARQPEIHLSLDSVPSEWYQLFPGAKWSIWF